jgi:hypothetical protein
MSNTQAYAYQDPHSKKWQMRSKRGTGPSGTRFCDFNPSSMASIEKACDYVGADGAAKRIAKEMEGNGYKVY